MKAFCVGLLTGLNVCLNTSRMDLIVIDAGSLPSAAKRRLVVRGKFSLLTEPGVGSFDPAFSPANFSSEKRIKRITLQLNCFKVRAFNNSITCHIVSALSDYTSVNPHKK